MRRYSTILRAAVLALLLPSLPACVPGTGLTTGPATAADLTGTYTLLLYGCHYGDDIKDLAILWDRESVYPIEIYDLPTSYTTKDNLAGPEALRRAEDFVRCSHRKVVGTTLRRIPDGKGGTVGFEVRPRYFFTEFGQEDVLLVNYALKDGRVRAYISLDPDVQRTLESSGDNDRDRGR